MAAVRWEKKRVIIVGFLLLALLFLCFSLMGLLPVPSMFFAYATVVVAAIPIAIFTIVPNAIVADIAEADGIETGNFKAGMFFGVRSFESNLGVSVANIMFPSLLLLGMSVNHPTGIRLTAILAIAICIAGLLVFLLYDEKAVLRSLAKKEKLSNEELQRLEEA
jgi:GPH family glycoside/pentoside/hexuronide:cation symporter